MNSCSTLVNYSSVILSSPFAFSVVVCPCHCSSLISTSSSVFKLEVPLCLFNSHAGGVVSCLCSAMGLASIGDGQHWGGEALLPGIPPRPSCPVVTSKEEVEFLHFQKFGLSVWMSPNIVNLWVYWWVTDLLLYNMVTCAQCGFVFSNYIHRTFIPPHLDSQGTYNHTPMNTLKMQSCKYL